MKFKRINIDTVRCLISQDELTANGLEVENFLQNDSKAEAFLRKVISMAEEEVGYKVKGGNISIQVSVLPENVVALTFSEKQDKNMANILENLKSVVENLSKNVNADENKEEAGETESPPHLRSAEWEDEIPGFSHTDCQIMFSSLDKIEQYCKSIFLELPVESSIYRLRRELSYFLLLKKEPMDDKQYCKLLSAALEFADSVYAHNAVRAYILEHGECIIEERAIQMMQEI